MRFLDTRRQRIAAAVLTLGVPGAWLLAGERRAADPSVVATVKRGEFRVVVTTAGELRARQFVQITVPTGGQQAGVYQIKISSIVPEGTVVKQGDVVAELDRTTVAPKLQEVSRALREARDTSWSFGATVVRSSSATTTPCFTTVPSGTIEEIFIWKTPACCPPGGAVTCTNWRARSSPAVVTTTVNGPRFTGATTIASVPRRSPARSQALGSTSVSTAAAMRCRRVGRKRM